MIYLGISNIKLWIYKPIEKKNSEQTGDWQVGGE